jgi:hypothetical protein
MLRIHKLSILIILLFLASCKPTQIAGEAFTQKHKLGAAEIKIFKKEDLIKELDSIESRRRNNITDLAIELNKANWKVLNENYDRAIVAANKVVKGGNSERYLIIQLTTIASYAQFQKEQLSLIDHNKVEQLMRSFNSDRFYWEQLKISQLKPVEMFTTDSDGKFLLKNRKQGLLFGRSADGELFWLIDMEKIGEQLQLTEFNTIRSRCDVCGLVRDDWGGNDLKKLEQISTTFSMMRKRELGSLTGYGSEIWTDKLLLDESKSLGISAILERLIR